MTVANGAKGSGEAVVRLDVPAGWTVEPAQAAASLRFEGDEVTARFFVTAPATLAAGEYAVRAVATRGGQEFREGFQVIAYDHIQERHLFHPAASRVQAIDVKVAARACRSATCSAPATRCRPRSSSSASTPTLLSRTTSPTATCRASRPSSPGSAPTRRGKDLRANNQRLLDYARAGGHVVVQYNKFEFNRLSDAPAEAFSGRRLRGRR